MSVATKRCAIYTRKSSEEGLEQDFNSLAAQREACAAYVVRQAGEGWRASATFYDDGGFSGGTLERPGLQRLLSDIDAGKIDIVVVYKVDRLTRSLTDFSKIVDRLDAQNACFVSVTQAFNTTTSMGRLTLNVLLSFAQFEREVTGERIRDKIAASKRKGMWMGGYVPLGYRAAGRTLEIVPAEAEQVREIYRRYLVLKSVPALANALGAQGIRSKVYVSKGGRERGGGKIGVGALRHMLTNQLYRGMIVHKKEIHAGQHAAIVDQDLFDAVQRRLSEKALPRGGYRRREVSAMLSRRAFTEQGRALIPVMAKGRGAGRHRYYIPTKARAGDLRVPAKLLESLVRDVACRILALGETEALERVKRVVVRARGLSVELLPLECSIELCRGRLVADEDLREAAASWVLTAPMRLRRWRGRTTAFDGAGKSLLRAEADAALLKAIGRAWAWRKRVEGGESLTNIAVRDGLPPPYVARIFRLAYLSPELTRAALSGQAPIGLTVDRFVRQDMPLDWSAQRRLFANAAPTAQREIPT